MEPFVTHTGRAVPLRRTNVDTDQIIPAVYLKRVNREGFGDGLFAAWREDPSFVLNQSRYAGGTILVASTDFGTGSSREHAVWALMDYGFRAVIAPRFGDIFRNNCTKAGLVPVQVDPDTGTALLRAVAADPTLFRSERRPASAGPAQRLHVEPELRGPPGQGRAHAPGVARGSRRHRRHGPPYRARRPVTAADA